MTETRLDTGCIFEEAVEQMKMLGIYKPEYDNMIQIYAELRLQYIILTDRFEKSNYKVQTKSERGGMKKSPIVATLEGLRKDILAYSDRLCLNPKSFHALDVTPEAPKSKLENLLGAMKNDSG